MFCNTMSSWLVETFAENDTFIAYDSMFWIFWSSQITHLSMKYELCSNFYQICGYLKMLSPKESLLMFSTQTPILWIDSLAESPLL